MRESFQLELEGADMRAVAGVLYELYYRSMVNSWPPYVFAEGVDIDFISKVKEQGLSGVEIEAATVRTYNTEYAAHLLGRVGAIENWDAYKDLDLDGDGTPDYEMDDTVGKEGAELVSCPTCGRTRIDLIALAGEVEERLKGVDKPITVAVMGCAVNGPGEASAADCGIAGGVGEGLLFKKGEIIKKVPQDQLVDELFALIDTL